MNNKECMENCVKALEKIRVPVGLLEDIGVTILAVRNTLMLQIRQLEEEEKRKEEKHADDTVQREDTEPEND